MGFEAGRETSSLEIVVLCPESMTLGAHAEVEELLREYGHVTRTTAGFTVRLMRDDVNDIVSQIGDYGPEEWARAFVGLPETADLDRDGEAAKMLYAIALSEWWASLAADLDRHGASILRDPEVE